MLDADEMGCTTVRIDSLDLLTVVGNNIFLGEVYRLGPSKNLLDFRVYFLRDILNLKNNELPN